MDEEKIRKKYLVRIITTPKKGILDPQGKAVCSGLHTLGFPEVTEVRVGKELCFTVETDRSMEDLKMRMQACAKALIKEGRINPNIEQYEIDIQEAPAE